MWGAALGGIGQAFDTKLSGAIDQVAGARGVALTNTFTRYRWKVPELNIRQYPALVLQLRGQGSEDVPRNAGIREGVLPLRAGYGFQGQDVDAVADHLEHVPEAIVMVVEALHELTTVVMDVDHPVRVVWDGRVLRATDAGPFEAWVAVDANVGLYADALVLA